MEFIKKHKKFWALAAIGTTIIMILFTIFGGAEEEEVGMYGKVEAKRVYLSFNMEYPIKEMLVREGDFVHKGDLLGTLNMDAMAAQVADEKILILNYEEELKDSTLDKDEKKLAYGRLNGLRADILMKERFLRQGRIIAPVDGIISQRLQEPGEMAVAMEPVYYLEIPNGKWVRAFANETYAKKLAKGKAITVVAEIMPETTVEGKVYAISQEPVALPEDIAKLSGVVQGYEVDVAVQDKENVLKVGSLVEVIVK